MSTLAQDAAQSAAQGQQMLSSDQANQNNYQGQYNTLAGQASAAQNQVKSYTDYMAGAGSAGNQYNNELGTQENELGYDPAQMTAARSNLNQATGAESAYSDFANTAASKFGLNAGGFAAANANALGSLNNNIASNQNVVTGLGDLYTTAQTGANQFAGQQVQGEANTLGGYQSAYTDAANQRDSALSMAQFYGTLAQTQGLDNSQQQQYYAAAQQAMAQATAADAQANLYGKQASQIQQQIDMANAASHATGATGATGSTKPLSVSQILQPTLSTNSFQPASSGIKLQGTSPSLQGNSTNLQGNSTNLQGNRTGFNLQ
jgi:hypothetical protein